LYIGLPNTISPTAKQPISKLGRWRAAPLRYDLDMGSGNFDRALAKYKPQAQSEAISVVEMFDRFTQQKQRTISISPLAKYLPLQIHWCWLFSRAKPVYLSPLSIAEKFRAYLAQKLEPGSVLTAKG